MCRPLLLSIIAFVSCVVSLASAQKIESSSAVGSWIWGSETHDRQECRFWKAFEIPPGSPVRLSRLRITADNTYTVYLDGLPVGQGGDWYSVIDYDPSKLLTPGTHILAVVAANDFDRAGLIAGLYAELADGRQIWVPSDSTWKIVPPDYDDADWKRWTPRARQWPDAVVVGTSWWANPPGIYQAARTEPEVILFWETAWFQIGVMSLCVVAVTGCIFLIGRLIVQSQMHEVIRRERSRIAADLHDDLGGRLSQLVLLGETTRRIAPVDSSTGSQLELICDQSRDLARSMNETVWLINAQRDNLKDFTAYICKYAEDFLQSSPIRCRFDIEDDLPRLPCGLGVRRNLFLAAKEALNNVLKHSGATEVIVRIHRLKGKMVITITDNGKGMDPSARGSCGNGMTNMHQRALDAGGLCAVTTTPGAGCVVKFIVPLDFTRRRFFDWLPRIWRNRPATLNAAPSTP